MVNGARITQPRKSFFGHLCTYAELCGDYPTSANHESISSHVGEAIVDIDGAVAEVFLFNADIGAAVEVLLRAIPDAE